jgi:hypothetical protein
MLENLYEFEKLTSEEAQKRIKELNREILKHEILFIIFILIDVLDIVLTTIGFISFNILTVLRLCFGVYVCYKIYKYSEPYEIERFFLKLIFGKKNIKGKNN